MAGKIKKWLMGAGLAGLVSFGCGNDAGIVLDKDYPKPTPARIEMIESKLKEGVDNESKVIADKETFDASPNNYIYFPNEGQEWVNHLADFMKDDMETDNASYPLIENITYAILPDKDMLEVCGIESAVACNGNDHITMPDYFNLSDFMPTLFHEIGHSVFDGSQEFPSKGNEVYMAIKAYQFSKPIGTLILEPTIDYMPNSKIEQEEPFIRMYNQGSMFAVINLLNNDCDIEKALDDVAHSKTIVIEAEISDKLSNTPGSTRADQFHNLWKEMLDSPKFHDELTGPTGHLSDAEAKEFIDYLRILKHSHFLDQLTDFPDMHETLVKLREDFAKNNDYKNPYFKAKVISDLLYSQARERAELLIESKWEEVMRFSAEVLEMNKNYPCHEIDAYTCPRFVRNARPRHVWFYDSYIDSAWKLDYTKAGIDRTIEFIEKFYPESDVETASYKSLQENRNPQTNNFAVKHSYRAALEAFWNGKNDLAKNLWTATITLQCNSEGIGLNYEDCLNRQSDAEFFLSKFYGYNQ